MEETSPTSSDDEMFRAEKVSTPSAADSDGNVVYDRAEEEPELHARTYIAVMSMFLLYYVQVFALHGPPVVLSYIGESLHNTPAQTWVPNALSLVQAVLGPLISSASDTFQARKFLLIGTCIISFIGAAIAPGSHNIYRLIVAQILIGFGFAAVPISYCVPSEILPRRWRSMVQAGLNLAATLAASTAPLTIGALTKNNTKNGWKNFYWIQMALWGIITIGIFFGYSPPKRHTKLDHLSIWQKLGRLDLPGLFLLTTGLTLFLTALNLGGVLYSWTSSRVLSLLLVGIVFLIAFGIYEWRFTKTGFMHHDLFHGGKAAGRTFTLCVGLIFIEGIMLFAYVIFYPVLTTELFEQDPFLLAARIQPFWIACMLTTCLWGYWSTRMRTIRTPQAAGFVLLTAGLIGLATIQPGDSTKTLVFAGLAGIGFGAPLVLIVSGVQLSTPHHLIATAGAVITSSRAIAATVFTAIYSTAYQTKLDKDLPSKVAKAAQRAGLPTSSIPALITAITNNNSTALSAIPGINATIINAASHASKQAFADSVRVVFIIAIPFGVVACIGCYFLGDMKSTMNYRVDAPIEDLHAKLLHGQNSSESD